jgi:hypothetical protein
MTGRLEVVVASTAPGFTTSSSAANSAVLTARSSTTASTTRSQSARSSSDVVPVVRARTASRVALLEPAALHGPVERALDAREHRGDLVLAPGADDHVVAGLRADLDDAAGHRPGADDADPPDLPRGRRQGVAATRASGTTSEESGAA